MNLKSLKDNGLVLPIVVSFIFALLNMFYSTDKGLSIFILFFVFFMVPLTLINRNYNRIFSSASNVKYDKKKDRKAFLTYFIVLLLSWTVVLLAFFPGIITYDSHYAATNITEGFFSVTPISVMLYSKLFWTINASISPYGFLLMILLQMTLYALSISFTLLFLYRLQSNKVLRILMLIFFALSPIISMMSITATKDILFAPFFITFITILAYYSYDKEVFAKRSYIYLLGISLVFILLIRSNGALLFYLSAIVLVMIFRNNVKNIVIIMGFFLAGLIINSILHGVTKINDKLISEAVNIPLQQIARVYNKHSDELSLEERHEIVKLIPYVKDYNQHMSDYIKIPVNRDNFPVLFDIWFKYLTKFFGDYVQAYMYNYQGYFYVLDDSVAKNYYVPDVHTYCGFLDTGSTPNANIEEISYIPFLKNSYREMFSLNHFMDSWAVRVAFNLYPFITLLFFFVLKILYGRDKSSICIAILVTVYFASLMIGPGVFVRYLVPIIPILPVLGFLSNKKKE